MVQIEERHADCAPEGLKLMRHQLIINISGDEKEALTPCPVTPGDREAGCGAHRIVLRALRQQAEQQRADGGRYHN